MITVAPWAQSRCAVKPQRSYNGALKAEGLITNGAPDYIRIAMMRAVIGYWTHSSAFMALDRLG